MGLIKAKQIIHSFIFLVIGQLLDFLYVPVVPFSWHQGDPKESQKVNDGRASGRAFWHLPARLSNCKRGEAIVPLCHYCEFSVQWSEVGSRSFPSLDFCDTILIILELSPKETRTDYRRPFFPLCFLDMQGHSCGFQICFGCSSRAHKHLNLKTNQPTNPMVCRIPLSMYQDRISLQKLQGNCKVPLLNGFSWLYSFAKELYFSFVHCTNRMSR